MKWSDDACLPPACRLPADRQGRQGRQGPVAGEYRLHSRPPGTSRPRSGLCSFMNWRCSLRLLVRPAIIGRRIIWRFSARIGL
ncbi:MAG: hypothetical protein BWX48_00737 [Verrucomicrobia bacterium ADurb.Bin006]|nr:MAG: hypothetical protein BWX48_00737 [Verrucomicrobia bacterium ADurb.Bin006]